MEKVSIQSSYTQVSLYAKMTVSTGKSPDGTAKLKADDGATGIKPDANAVARSADGDTFTLSIEARAIQVSESVTIGTNGDAAQAHGCERPNPGAQGKADAIMDAFDHPHSKHGGRRHHYARLGDAEDVAARIYEDWDREFASKGGSRRDFAEGVRRKLAHWQGNGGTENDTRRITIEHREFRSEVAIRITGRLEDWTAVAPGDASQPAGEAPAVDTDPPEAA